VIVTTPGARVNDDARSELTLPAAASAPKAARHFLADTLHRWQVTSGVVDLATLLTSELVTNAVRYGRGLVRLSVRTAPPAVRVEVHDDNPALPTLGPEDDSGAEGGRGLRLIDSLATRWGTHPHPGDGKDVWFEIDVRQD
jgi:anti-sigma regulatory factor (Ser/Thr protein kinase)